MQIFFITDIQADTAHIGEEEAKHFRVLRKKIGDSIHFIDGKGTRYVGKLTKLSKRKGTLQIVEQKKQPPERSFHLHIAIAPTKNISRMEWFVEKATEIGVNEITPIICQQSERTRLRLDRLEKIAVSAMKQSLRTYLPKLNEARKLKDFLLDNQEETPNLVRYIAHCDDSKKANLWDNYRTATNVLILIGPEGDFSTEEIEMATQLGFQPVSLGTHRLRTETAGITACNILNLLNQKSEI